MSANSSPASGIKPTQHKFAKAVALWAVFGAAAYGLYGVNEYWAAKNKHLDGMLTRAGVQDKDEIGFIKKAASDNFCGLLSTPLAAVCHEIRDAKMVPQYR